MANKIKMNPILNKELRLGSRSIRLPLCVMFYDIVLAIIAVISIFVVSLSGTYDDSVNFSGYLYIYQIIGWSQLGITLLIVPILTAGTISGEREKQTLEIMLTTPKKPLSIVWGKLLAALSNYLIFVISSIPIMAIAFVLGGLNWFALLGYIFMMVVVAIYVGSVGVFCSSAFKKTIVSIVLTFLIEAGLFIIPVVLFIGIMGVGAIIYEYLNYEMGMSLPDINFGILPFIMIGNPLIGFGDYMVRTMDITSFAEMLKEMDIFGTIMPILAHAWIPLNVIVSMAISFFFISMAAKLLNPIKKHKRKKKNKQMMVNNPVQQKVNPQLYQPHSQAVEQIGITEQLKKES